MAGTPEPVSGTRDVTNLETALRVVDMWDTIILLNSDKKNFITFTGSLGQRQVKNPKFEWQTDEVMPPNDTTTASCASGGTTLALTGDGSDEVYVTVNETLYIPSTGEQVRVTAVSARNLTITRAFGDTAAASIASGATVVRLAGSWNEMSTLRDSNNAYIATTNQTANNLNYTQFHRKAVPLGHRAKGSELYGGNYREHQQLLALLDVCSTYERSFLFGDLKAPASANSGATKGAWRWVPSANQNTITTLTEDDLESFIRTATLDGSGDTKKLFASRQVKQIISRLAAPNQRIKPGVKKYGVTLDEYTAGSGETIEIIGTRAFEESGESDSALLIDPRDVRLAVFDGMNIKLYENVQQNDQHGSVDEYAADIGYQAGNAAHSHRMTGVTG